MRTQVITFLLLQLASERALAQVLKYTTAIITTCYTEGSEPASTSAPAASDGNVYCEMPQWPGGDCFDCVQTSIFVTNFNVFCPTGTSQQAYTVTEVYSGMSSLPTFESSTCVPYGFTTAEHTCTVCGSTPVCETMTYPSGSHPYGTDLPAPTQALPTQAPLSQSLPKPNQSQAIKATATPTQKSIVTVSLAGHQVSGQAAGMFFLIPVIAACWILL